MPIIRTLQDSMRTLTGLSGEYVTFDQNGQNAISVDIEILAANLPSWRFGRIKNVIRTMKQNVKVEGFGNSKFLNFRSDYVTFLRNVRNGHFGKNEEEKQNNISCDCEKEENRD